MRQPRWLIRLAGVIATALVIAFSISWSVERGYLYDLLAPALRENPQYGLTASLMRERQQRAFNVLTIGSPHYVDQIASSFAPCIKNLKIRLPAYHYNELRQAIRMLRPFQFDYLFIQNHPAFWSSVHAGSPIVQKRDAWHGFRRRQQPSQVRADLRVAFTLITDAIKPAAPVKTAAAQQLASAYTKARYHEEIGRWDLTGAVRSLLKQVSHQRVYWIMGFEQGPSVDSNPELRKALEDRFTQKNFDPVLGHLYSIDDHGVAAKAVSAQVCKN